MDQIARILEPDESTAVSTVKTMILSLPRFERKCDALVAYPGMGETWRLTEIISVWQSHLYMPFVQHLLVAGTEWQKEATAIRPPIIENLKKPPFYLRRLKNVWAQDHARHTKDQAEWVVAKTQELHIGSLALFVSPYHLTRAYLTLLKTFINLKVAPIQIIPVPVAISPDTIIPETGTDAWEMIAGEDRRILDYQKKGDVATLPELKEYLSWLWKQPLLQN